jgi:hypothetical protein
MTAKDPWSDVLDAEHPVRWRPADDDHPGLRAPDKFITLKGAADRLARYGFWHETTVDDLVAGRELRTPYASYSLELPA